MPVVIGQASARHFLEVVDAVKGEGTGLTELVAPSVRLLSTVRHDDARGHFCETYSRPALADVGIDVEFVQDNQSFSLSRSTVRGLHFQCPPFAQAKLIRVIRGAIFDVAVDLRRGSPTYGCHACAMLSAENRKQLFVPVGFAHGFATLEPETEVAYKVSRPYAPAHECGLLWNDPELGIDWPFPAVDAILSEKDGLLPPLSELDSPFEWDS